MRRKRDLSIRKKLLISILAFTVLLVVSVTGVAGFISYRTMREQLIYNRRMSSRWLQDRLNTQVDSYSDRFYEFEVNKQLKDDITYWCGYGQELDYEARLELITAMNKTISMDKNLNSMAIYNFSRDEVLVAKRSGAGMEKTEDKLQQWDARDPLLQTNCVFFRNGKEIIVLHKIYNFSDNRPIALITMSLRPYEMEETLEDIKTTKDESVLIFNDQKELIEAEYGTGAQPTRGYLTGILDRMDQTGTQELFWDGSFWFLREVGQGKLTILMTVPNSSIMEALKSTYAAGIAIGALAVMISAVGSFIFSRAFSKPIIELSARMRTITIDDYDHVIPNERKDEIGILHDSFAVMIGRNKKLIAQEYQSKIEKREAQLHALQAQINPHFMYNTLQVIGGMALKNEVSEVYKMTTALGDIMRYSLDFSNEMVCLKEEITYFQAYLTIQNERFGNRIHLEMKIGEELMDCRIPKLILQPLLENSLEHGLTNKPGKWEIRLEGRINEEGNLLLTLSDNGVGIEPDRLEQIRESLRSTEKSISSGSHIGLCNVNSRLRLKYYDDKYGITIASSCGEGTVVQILAKAVRQPDREENTDGRE